MSSIILISKPLMNFFHDASALVVLKLGVQIVTKTDWH
jgi:hypothetical protein